MQLKRRLTALNIPEALALANLTGIRADLSHVEKCCDQIRALYEADNRGPFYAAISHSAVIGYARCFATGVRTNLSANVFSNAPVGMLALHTHFIELRNKHIAHSVNAMEESRAVVSWEKRGHRYEVVDVGAIHTRSSGLSQRQYTQLARLVKWLLSETEEMCEQEKAKFRKLVLQMDKAYLRSFGSAFADLSRVFEGQIPVERPRRK